MVNVYFSIILMLSSLHYESKYEGDLIRKCYFASKILSWFMVLPHVKHMCNYAWVIVHA